MDMEKGDQVTKRGYLCPLILGGGVNYPQDSRRGYVTPITPLIYATVNLFRFLEWNLNILGFHFVSLRRNHHWSTTGDPLNGDPQNLVGNPQIL